MSSKRFATGLVIGKFYPPHRGHSYLIDVACMQADHVTVIVCDHASQSIGGHLRAAWLREMHPHVQVLRIDDIYPDDSQVWATQTVGWLGHAPDAVFTSEEYGDRYAALMGSTHVQVDRARTAVPCSGTQVRADPGTWWDYIAPCVRAYYCARVVLVGAELTGKTTLAQALAAHYQTTWAPEYGRAYCAMKVVGPHPTTWRTAEFVHIAREQCRWEEAAARQANRIMIGDTDAFATAIWHERYLGAPSAAVDEVAACQIPDLYVVTDIDIPFTQDGTRDGEHVRPWMHRRVIEALEAQGRPYVVVSGSPEARLQAAIQAIDARVPSPSRRNLASHDVRSNGDLAAIPG